MPKKQKLKSADESELTQASAVAMSAMRALNYEATAGYPPSLIVQRVGQVVTELAAIMGQFGLTGSASELSSVARSIQRTVEESYGFKPNSRRPSDSRGLADDPVLLKAYCEMAAESMELENWKDAEPNDEVFEVAREYDSALRKALEGLVDKYPPENDASADDLWNANGPYLVLMTLRGEGVGIWDGDWTEFYEDTDKAEKFLKGKLGKFSAAGGGKLEEAFINAASESCGEDEDDSEEDDDDEDED